MCELKRTQLYEAHLACGGQMVDFGGWEMPIQYPSGIVTNAWKTYPITMDRGVKFALDRTDPNDTGFIGHPRTIVTIH